MKVDISFKNSEICIIDHENKKAGDFEHKPVGINYSYYLKHIKEFKPLVVYDD